MKSRTRLLLTAATVVVPAVASFVFDGPYVAPIAVFATAITLWFTQLLPLPVTGLLIPVLTVLYGIFPVAKAFAPFGSDILFLFLACFFLSRAMQKHGWDKRMSYWLLATRVGSRPPAVLIAVVAGMSWLLSMWITNTATCAILVPICLGIISVVEEQGVAPGEVKAFSTRLLLACAFASTMGGLATPIGTPANLIALQFLRDRGVHLSFYRWLSIGLPVSLILLAALLFILARRYPLRGVSFGDVRHHFRDKLAALGRVKREEVTIAVVFGLTVALWVLPGIVIDVFPDVSGLRAALAPLSLSVVGVCAAILLFVLPTRSGAPILVWDDAAKIDWGTILLFGGGLSLGVMLDRTGLAAAAGEVLFTGVTSPFLIVAIGVALAVAMSEFSSNTASASVVIPILVATTGSDRAIESVVLGAAFAASFGFMLPVSTPPNAMVYGTGRIELRELIRTGVIFDLVGAAILVVYLSLV